MCCEGHQDRNKSGVLILSWKVNNQGQHLKKWFIAYELTDHARAGSGALGGSSADCRLSPLIITLTCSLLSALETPGNKKTAAYMSALGASTSCWF